MNLLLRNARAAAQHNISSAGRRSAIVDSDQPPVTNIQPSKNSMNDSRSQPRFTMLLLGAFSATALALAVDRNLRSALVLGWRNGGRSSASALALGAEHWDILGLVLRQGALLAIAGIALV